MTLPALLTYRKLISGSFSKFTILFWNKANNNSEEKLTGFFVKFGVFFLFPSRVDSYT